MSDWVGVGTRVIVPRPGTETAVDLSFTNALADIFTSVLGVDAIYAPAAGAAISCRVILEKNVLLQPDSMTAQVFEHGTTIEVMLVDVVAEPNRGDTFTIGTETFAVQSIAENDGLTVKMIVT